MDKQQWTNKSKRGPDQATTFLQNKFPEAQGERDFSQIVTTKATRGEDNVAKIQTAK